MSYARGATRERQVAELEASKGWCAIRSAGSHGPADVIVGRSGHTTKAIQVKTDRLSPWAHFGPADRQELVEWCEQAGWEAWLCWWPFDRGGPRWLPASSWPSS